MGYADLDAVRTMLGLAEADIAPGTPERARLDALDGLVSAVFAERVGRSWGGAAPVAETRAVDARGASPVLILPAPGLRSYVSAYVDPAPTGTGWTGGAPVADVEPIWADARGAWQALRRRDGWAWRGAYGVVLVTGVWDSLADGAAPADVVEAVSWIVAEERKQEKASPESQIGPDGLSIPTRNPWDYPRVTNVVDRYRVADRVVI